MCLLLPVAIPPYAFMWLPRRHGLAMGYTCKLPRPWQKGFCPNIHRYTSLGLCLLHVSWSALHSCLCVPVWIWQTCVRHHVDTEHICKHHAVHRFCSCGGREPKFQSLRLLHLLLYVGHTAPLGKLLPTPCLCQQGTGATPCYSCLCCCCCCL